jgi:ABC-2 type transport system ATP-binding protein
MSKKALIVENLSKNYLSTLKNGGEIKALNNINFEVKMGEIFGLLGPNGAGKTTFINILAGTVIKTEGKINVWGFDLDSNPRQVKASIGIVPQEVNLDAFFSPKKLLELQAGLYGVKKKDRITEDILRIVSLEKKANAYSRSLSGGMKRRLLIAKAMVHQPPVLILDEPTAGVDVELRQNLWKNVKELNKRGVTIILTTHYLFEAEEMCDRIAILNKGNLVALDSPKALLDQIKYKKVQLKLDGQLNGFKDKNEGIKIEKITNDTINVSYEKKRYTFNDILKILIEKNLKILDISADDGDLEEVFVELTKS